MSIVIESSQTPTMKFKYEKLKLVASCTLTKSESTKYEKPKNIIELNMLKPKNKLSPEIEYFVGKKNPNMI
jgi:histidinol phosphatase-like enzyme